MNRWLLVFLQHFCIGLVGRAIATESWVVVFVAALLQQWVWWANMGTRIDLHGSMKAQATYAVISATGIVLGAMLVK